MNNEQKKLLLSLSIAGILFLLLGIHDVFISGPAKRSELMIDLEITAGLVFIVNAFVQWSKYKNNKTG